MKKYLVGLMVIGALLGFVGCGGSSSSGEKTEQTGTTDTGTTDTGTTDTGTTDTGTTLPKVDGRAVFTKEYLNGKTLYLASPDSKDVTSFKFSKDSFVANNVYKRALNPIPYSITDEGYITFVEPDSKKTAFFKAFKDDNDKISLAFSYEKASLANVSKANKYFYFAQDKAQTYIQSLPTDSGTTAEVSTTDSETTDSTVQKAFKFSKEFLNGKTLYNVYEECDGTHENGKCSTKTTWEMSVFKFTDTQVTGYEVKDPTNNLKGDYTISSKGYLILPDTEDKNAKDAIKAIEKTDKYISLIWDKEGSSRLDNNIADNEYFFFNEAEAKKFIEEKNNSTDNTVQKAFKFSKEFLNGKTLYNVYEDCDDGTYENSGKCSTWGMSVFKFTDTQVTGYEVKDPTHNLKGDYTISSKGYIILPDTTDKNAKDAIKAIEKTDKYISLIWDSEGSSRLDSNIADNEYFFFNEADAKKFMDEKNRK